MLKSITLSTADHLALRTRLSLIHAQSPGSRSRWQSLHDELERAQVLPVESLPPDIVRVGSTFTTHDLDSDERDTFTLVWPEKADVEQGRLSVLAPLGIAVIGFGEGDEISWTMPGGLRRLRLEAVRAPAV